jgi:hypothetical protein
MEAVSQGAAEVEGYVQSSSFNCTRTSFAG